MPSKIRVLSEQTINQIAAGEVIENPASVVKELIENAIDAEAKEISVEIVGGGRNLIRITDNGLGMTKDDAILCLERHATSKIKHVDDIATLMTMGFRGEAIPSIASISKFSILTCATGENKGTLVIVDGGKLLECQEAVTAKGTTVEVKSLFFNVPVRRKFQKSPNYDTNEILKVVTTISLANPHIKFELISNEKKILSSNCLQNDDFLENLKNRIETLLGKDFAESMYKVDSNLNGYQIHGFIGFPTVTRQNRTGQYLFINQRCVQNSTISYFVKMGYGTMLQENRYPIYVLHITIPGDLVDVNVHPQKREVRLREEQILKELIIKSVEKALQHLKFSNDEETSITSSFVKYPVNYPQFSLTQKFPNIPREETSIPSYESYREYFSLPEKVITPDKNEEQPDFFSTQDLFSEIQVLAVIPEFILIDKNSMNHAFFQEKKEALVCLVDQKAAYSRIVFENLSKNKATAVQSLLIPYTFTTNAFEEALILEQLEFLNQIGLHIYQNAPQNFIVDAIPEFFANTDIEQFVTDLILQLQEFKKTHVIDQKLEKRLAISASRAAISYQRRLSIEEAKQLLNRLMKCEMPYQCPKGKKIFAFVTKEELQSFF